MDAKKKSVAAQALLDMDTIVAALKEESKKTLGGILNESVKSALRESVEDDEEKDYEVVDDEKDDAEDSDESKDSSSSDVSEQGEDELENGAAPEGGEMPAAAAGEQPQGQDMGAQEAPIDGAEAGEAEAPQDGEGEEGWGEFSKYQVGDNTYDFTGENDYDSVVKVYKLLKDDDQVVVKKDGNTVQLQDGQAGTEYVIDLGGEGEEPTAEGGDSGGEEAPSDNLSEGFDVAGFPDSEDEEPDGGVDVPNGSQPWDDSDDFESEFDNIDGDEFDGIDDGLNDDSFATDELGADDNNLTLENKKTRKPMKESKEVLFEVDLGYTDNYQDKDPIKGLSNNEPSKSGKSWHKGVPTGTEKPWAGSSKDKGKPFGDKTVEEEKEACCPKCGKCGDECTCEKEVDEATNVGGFVQQNTTVGSHIPNSNGRKARSQRSASQGVEVTGTPDPRYKGVNESKELKAIKAENRELKKAVLELRKNLNEAYITNVNLGKITKLFLENTTSKAEKIDIVNRFSNEAKTVEQSQTLYESIDRELKKTNSQKMNLTESSKTAKGTKELNEEKTYKSPEVLRTIDFMNRVMSL